MIHRLHAIDSHTEGEPTRIIISGGPDLGNGPLHERRDLLVGVHDRWRKATVEEPRGNDVIVGGWLCEVPGYDTGIIFYNNAGALGMCGHGTIGLVATLRHLGRIGEEATVKIATPVGDVIAFADPEGRIGFENIPAFVHELDLVVEVPGFGAVRGDIAYGGNWFFLTHQTPEIRRENVGALMAYATAIRHTLDAQGITGRDGAHIDHVELLGDSPVADSRNFVLCPGLAYDRSPCGTGTSAHLATLVERGELRPGEVWRQESVTGGLFLASFRREGAHIIPRISGRSFVTADSTLIIDEDDPLAWGFA